MLNIVRKSNNQVVATFNTEDEAKSYLANLGPQRNFLKIEALKEVVEKATSSAKAKVKKATSSKRQAGNAVLSQEIVAVLNTKEQHSACCSEIAKALVADGTFETQQIAIKKVTDRCWLMEKQGLLTKESKGVYRLK